MAQAASPRGTRAVTTAFLDALAALPPDHRKVALRHASVAVREKLAKDADKAKAGATRAARAKSPAVRPRLTEAVPTAPSPARPRVSARRAGPANEASVPDPVRRPQRTRSVAPTGQRTVPASELTVPTHAETAAQDPGTKPE